MRIFLASAFLFFSPLVASAIEAQDPMTLCDRFVTEADQKNCSQKIKTISPDWYLAWACSHQFDDSLFYTCLESGKNAVFAPPALEKCSSEDLTDEARLSCVKTAQTSGSKSSKKRSLASHKVQKKATARPTPARQEAH